MYVFQTFLKNIPFHNNSLEGEYLFFHDFNFGRQVFNSYVFQAFICGPLELVKIQQQVRPECTSATETVRSLVDKTGFKGLTRGLGLTVLREVPAFGLYFSSYEFMVKLKKDSAAWVFTAGGLAGIISWIFTYPIDVVKSRIQADNFGAGLAIPSIFIFSKFVFLRF